MTEFPPFFCFRLGDDPYTINSTSSSITQPYDAQIQGLTESQVTVPVLHDACSAPLLPPQAIDAAAHTSDQQPFYDGT